MGVAFPTLSLPFESPTDVNRVNVSFRVLDICRDQLGIAPSMPPELEPALKRLRKPLRKPLTTGIVRTASRGEQ